MALSSTASEARRLLHSRDRTLRSYRPGRQHRARRQRTSRRIVSARDFDSVVTLAHDSVLWRLVRHVAEGWRAAWTTSAIVHGGRRVWNPVSSWPAETKLRCTGLTIAWMAGGYAVSQVILPRYVVSG